jgi:hypothetical protein
VGDLFSRQLQGNLQVFHRNPGTEFVFAATMLVETNFVYGTGRFSIWVASKRYCGTGVLSDGRSSQRVAASGKLSARTSPLHPLNSQVLACLCGAAHDNRAKLSRHNTQCCRM